MIDPNSALGRYLNDNLKYACRMPMAALQRQAVLAFPGDPLAGTKLAGTSLAYNEATQTQLYIALFYSEGGSTYPENMDSLLKDNPGPALPWNYSYSQWGVDKPQAA